MRVNKDFFLGIIVLVIGLFFVVESYQFPKGEHLLNSSRSFPMLLGFILMGLAVWQLVLSFKNSEKQGTEKLPLPAIKRGVVFIILTAVYIFLVMPLIGFLASSFVFLVVGLLYFKEVRWYTATFISLGMIGFLYVFFEKVMLISFP
ncbi:tripartite tricarboxylate transporter TctB family protein [Siminovitchia acidinfaciens]|uniref:Tripartite tricarboxylate transporter TctB family protein n=1 Tax=Siminovitchia acidinfaciens TaxID=2321395 RepID=A0A429XZB8_9BACI|nr:tripartite tricarboxylate transporter TctB family protein [Siminovitchia acidinfaciens]RST74134.1 tripartite tricarboxylate transporter TctB family protein [Siminovitchia acidinfaciens]